MLLRRGPVRAFNAAAWARPGFHCCCGVVSVTRFAAPVAGGRTWRQSRPGGRGTVQGSPSAVTQTFGDLRLCCSVCLFVCGVGLQRGSNNRKRMRGAKCVRNVHARTLPVRRAQEAPRRAAPHAHCAVLRLQRGGAADTASDRSGAGGSAAAMREHSFWSEHSDDVRSLARPRDRADVSLPMAGIRAQRSAAHTPTPMPRGRLDSVGACRAAPHCAAPHC
jgi:hypothetical protein